jgi:hypothetical protein
VLLESAREVIQPRDLEPALRFLKQESVDAFVKLVETIKRGKCVAFVGSGISQDAGYPSWKQLVKQMADSAEVPLNDGDLDNEDTYTTILDKCKERLNRDQYYDEMVRIFDPDTKKPYSEMHRLILEIPFVSHFTTNVDDCHLRALRHVADPPFNKKYFLYPTLEFDGLKDRSIYYLHGKVGYRHSLVFSESEYRRAYDTESSLPEFLVYCFKRYDCVFLGYSLKDPAINQIIKKSKGRLDWENAQRSEQERELLPEPKRFAVMLAPYESPPLANVLLSGERQSERVDLLKNEMLLKELNIMPIYYQKKVSGDSDDHSSLFHIIDNLHSHLTNGKSPLIQPM